MILSRALALVLAGLSTSPALALMPPDSGATNPASRRDAVDWSRAETRRLTQTFGRCLAERQTLRSDQYVNAGVGEGDYDSFNGVGRRADHCMPRNLLAETRLRLRGEALRYALADGLLRQLATPLSQIDVAAAPELARTIPQSRVEISSLTAEQRAVLAAQIASFEKRLIGECIIRQNPAAARALLEADVASVEERAAFSTVATVLPACVASGAEARMSRFELRGSIALNYYLLARASGVQLRGA